MAYSGKYYICKDCGVRKPLYRNKRERCASCAKKGKRNPLWKGVSVGRVALHNWVRRNLLKPAFCQDCKIVSPYDLANISQEYRRDLSDWEWLCRRCHMIKDGRINTLVSFNIPRIKPLIHGTVSGYKNKHCRCRLCTLSNNSHIRINRRKKVLEEGRVLHIRPSAIKYT